MRTVGAVTKAVEELALVACAIGVREHTAAIHQIVAPFSDVLVTILPHERAVAVLLAKKVGACVASIESIPVAVVKARQEQVATRARQRLLGVATSTG